MRNHRSRPVVLLYKELFGFVRFTRSESRASETCRYKTRKGVFFYLGKSIIKEVKP